MGNNVGGVRMEGTEHSIKQAHALSEEWKARAKALEFCANALTSYVKATTESSEVEKCEYTHLASKLYAEAEMWRKVAALPKLL